jgi:hypothetical protein
MTPSLRVGLYVTDFECDPDRISVALGIEPTATWLKGQPIGGSARLWSENGWSMETRGEGYEVDSFVRFLLEKLPSDFHQRLDKVATRWEVQCSIVVSLKDETPSLNLSAYVVRRLSELEASVDIDLYLETDAGAQAIR